MSLTGSTSFGFAQNMIHDFQNTVNIKLIVALSLTNITKTWLNDNTSTFYSKTVMLKIMLLTISFFFAHSIFKSLHFCKVIQLTLGLTALTAIFT